MLYYIKKLILLLCLFNTISLIFCINANAQVFCRSTSCNIESERTRCEFDNGGRFIPKFGGSNQCICEDPNGSCNSNVTNFTTTESSSKALIDMAALLDVIINVLYIIIRPLLAITGLALDNSLIYGDMFHMSDMLYKFRRMMMNISFILLALLILRDITSPLLKGEDISKILKEKLKNRFLAGIFIPASRFIVATLIDLSTLLVYQVGGIPLTILGKQDGLNVPILQQNSVLNLMDSVAGTTGDNGGFRYSSTFSCGKEIFIPCVLEKHVIKTDTWNQEIAKAKIKYGSGNTATQAMIESGKNYCVLSPTQLMKIEFDTDLSNSGNQTKSKELLLDGSTHMKNIGCTTIKGLIDSSKSMVGPLYSIYGGLLNFTSLNVTTSSKSTSAEVMLFLIKTVVGLLLIFPLIALCLTSLARVGILRMTIAFSPLIVLYHYFSKSSDLAKGIGDNLKFTGFGGFLQFNLGLKGILQLIFQPVLVVMCLGISIVFLSATNNMLNDSAAEGGLLSAIGIGVSTSKEADGNYQKFTIKNNDNNTSDIMIKEFDNVYGTDIFFNYFSWILSNILGIMVMRQMMFWALRSSDLTKSIVNKTEDFGKAYLSSRPIFGGLSYDSVGKVVKDVTGEVTKHLSEDTTKGAADELIQNITERMPRSTAQSDFNSKFDVSKGSDENSATDELATGLMANDKSTFSASDSNAPAFKQLRDKANISGSNFEDMLKNDDFRNKMSRSKKGQALLTYMSDEKNLNALAGKNTGLTKKLKEIYTSKVNNIRNGYGDDTKITLGDPVKDESITTAYIRNDGIYSYTTSLKDKNTTMSKVEYGAKGSKEAADILNGGFKNNESYASAIGAKSFNPNGSGTEPTGLVYNTATKRYEVRTDDDEKNRPKPKPTPESGENKDQAKQANNNTGTTNPGN